MTIRNYYNKNGFTLIEVLVALALFAVALNIISASFINVLIIREKKDKLTYESFAIDTARKQLLLEKNIEEAQDGATFENYEIGETSWSSEIFPTEIVDLYECNLTIDFLDQENLRHEETLFLLRPTWSQSDERLTLLEDKKNKLINERPFESF